MCLIARCSCWRTAVLRSRACSYASTRKTTRTGQLASGAGGYISSTSSTGGVLTPTNVQDDGDILHFFARLTAICWPFAGAFNALNSVKTRSRARTRALGAVGCVCDHFRGPAKMVLTHAAEGGGITAGSPAGGVCVVSGPRWVEGLCSIMPLVGQAAQRPKDQARSAATSRPGRPAQRGRTGRRQGPERTPGAEEAGGRQRKAAQRASERRRLQTHTREPGQKPPNSYRKPRPRRTGGTGATGAGSAQGAHKRPKDQIRARAAKRPGRGATRTRAGRQPAHGGAAPGAEAHNQADPTSQSRAARPIGARG